jgi:hypothetical protein
MSKLYQIYEDSMTPVGWSVGIFKTRWQLRCSRGKLGLVRAPDLETPKWANWRTRDSDGWVTYHAEKPKVRCSAGWFADKGKADLSDSYFEEQRKRPAWFWKGGLFWSLMAAFTRRRIRRAR